MLDLQAFLVAFLVCSIPGVIMCATELATLFFTDKWYKNRGYVSDVLQYGGILAIWGIAAIIFVRST